MTRRGVAFWILLALAAVPAAAETLEDVEFTYYSRMRYENLNNFDDLLDHGGTEGNDRASFWSMRNQIGIGARVAEGVRFDLEIQNLGSFGGIEPRRSDFDPTFQNTPNSGASTFGEEKSDTSLYRAVIGLHEIGGSRVSVEAGRQEFVLASGLILGNEPFYGGITVDGINGWYDGGKWQAGAFWFKSRERNDPGSQFFIQTGGSDDQDIYGGYGRFRAGSEEGRHVVEVYAVGRQDNAEAAFDARDVSVGAGWSRQVRSVAEARANPMAWEAEVVYQKGSTDILVDPNMSGVDLSAWVFDGWFGWNITSGQVLHMPYAGVFMIPGESDLDDDDVTLFRNVLPTRHGRTGETDFAAFGLSGLGFGVNAYTAGYRITTDSGRHTGELAAWRLETAEDEVRFGTSSLELDDVGTEVNLLYDYAYRENVHLYLTLARLIPADALADLVDTAAPFPSGDDPVTRIYGGFLLFSK